MMNPREKLIIVPRDFTYYTTLSAPAPCLITNIKNTNLYPGLRRTPHRPVQVFRYQFLQYLVHRQPDKIADAPVLAVLVYFGLGKCNAAPKPEQPEPLPVSLNQWLGDIQHPVGGMHIARPQFRRQTIPFTGEAEYRVITIQPEVAVL